MVQSSATVFEYDYHRRLMTPDADFGAIYTAVAGLQFSIGRLAPDELRATIRALAHVLEERRHKMRRQSYFLHRKVADTLQEILTGADRPDIADEARRVLAYCLSKTGTTALRAAAEALGSLPLFLPAPELPFSGDASPSTHLAWPALLDRVGEKPAGPGFWKGRNLILPLPGKGRILIIKTATRPDERSMLHAEGAWMEHLSRIWPRLCDRPGLFIIPEPISVNGGYVFKTDRLPGAASTATGKTPVFYAAGYISHPDYFSYPNEYEPSRPLSNREVVAILSNGAFILGRLASAGIIHTAPIPLFHNRIQRHRRDDGGLYQWTRGGRLDRWLDSCRYPNIGKTGLRDFEHFVSFHDSPRKLYEYIGAHLLSLVLIAGSCFRNRDASRIGIAPDGSPMDARDLFDPVLLKAVLTRIFYAYYQGFTGRRFSGKPPLDMGRLTARVIEEMGVDRHMEEILRVAEQVAMTDREFAGFLMDRGFQPEKIAKIKKGAADITILTGPHLGAFNSSISLPELTEFSAVTAAVCVAGRFFSDKREGF